MVLVGRMYKRACGVLCASAYAVAEVGAELMPCPEQLAEYSECLLPAIDHVLLIDPCQRVPTAWAIDARQLRY